MKTAAVCIGLVGVCGTIGSLVAGAADRPASLRVVSQRRDAQGARLREPIVLEPAKTAVVVIDMWDKH